jgi:hypothetical protein
LGTRHVLFPRPLTFGAQFHPSSVAGCQFPDATLVCMNNCNPFRPRSGAGQQCFHRRLSGETSQPGIHTLASALRPDPVQMRLRTSASSPLPQGRHRTAIRWSRSLASRHGSCLLSLKLRFPSQLDDSIFSASRCSDLIDHRSHRWPSSAFLSVHSIRGSPFPVSRFRLRHRHDLAAVLFVQNRRVADHHTGSQ